VIHLDLSVHGDKGDVQVDVAEYGVVVMETLVKYLHCSVVDELKGQRIRALPFADRHSRVIGDLQDPEGFPEDDVQSVAFLNDVKMLGTFGKLRGTRSGAVRTWVEVLGRFEVVDLSRDVRGVRRSRDSGHNRRETAQCCDDHHAT
jgi:hypothetical protein